jgi:parallel beta-helix repeat protein
MLLAGARTPDEALLSGAATGLSGSTTTGPSERSQLMKLLVRSCLGWSTTVFLVVLVAKAAGADFYVVPSGNDAWPGTREQPFATLERARDAVRRARRSGELGAGGVTIWLRGGVYFRSGTFALTAEDSGSTGAPVNYLSPDGETPRITGGRDVNGFGPVTDGSVLRRLDSGARDHVLQVSLPAQGITDFGELQPRGFGRPRWPAALELFFRGSPMPLARWPNRGFSTIDAVPGTGGARDNKITTIGPPAAGFFYSGSRPSQWQDASDIWVHGYWAYDWADSYQKVASIDLRLNLIKTSPPAVSFGFRPGQRFYYLNILEELDEPGEWYLDRQTGILYFWPPAPIREGDVSVSIVSEPLVILSQADYINLQGLTFECGRSDGLRVIGGTGNTVQGCTIRNLGEVAVMVEGCPQAAVRDCEITQTGEAALWLRAGDLATLAPGGLEAVNNNIHSFARWCRCYQPAILIGGVGNHIAHNHFSYGPHEAIQLNGNNHVIELNEIDHVCYETGDAGAFYMGRDWTYQGNILRYNCFHDIQGVGGGANAVYLDDLASGTTVFGNIFYNTLRGVYISGGRDNRVENNIFVDCHPAVMLDDKGLSKVPYVEQFESTEMKQLLQAMHPDQPPYRTNYPDLAKIEKYYAAGRDVPPGRNVIYRNIAWEGEWLKYVTQSQNVAAYASVSRNLVGVDPKFVDPAAIDFSLEPGSPAFRLGFETIPLDSIGLIKKPGSPSPRQ